MTYLLIRSLPWLAAIASWFAAEWQWSDASIYPYPLLAGFVVFAISAVAIAWRRVTWHEFFVKSIPSFVLWGSAALAMLVVEDPWARIAITGILTGVPLVELELFFLLAVDPGRYPVHGLSRMNVALTPLSAFLLATALDGLHVYLQFDGWAMVAIFAGFGSLMFALTSHHASSHDQDIRWTLLGLLAGIQAGFLVYLLPVSFAAAGLLAALVIAVPLRIRRYAFQPVPARRVAVLESSGAALLLAAMLLLSRWA